MSIYAISDLHLSNNTNKSMEVFGEKWLGYTEKLFDNWKRTVTDADTVVIGGDVSWEMNLKNCAKDFEFIHKLPGRKIISKGNHDYWWETVTKMKKFISENGFTSIEFLYNNFYVAEGVAICGTRWFEDPESDNFKKDDLKTYAHELVRLENSLKEAKKSGCEKILAVLHYPPFTPDGEVNRDIKNMFEKYNVEKCIYGHLHGAGLKNVKEGCFFGTNYHLTSADYLDFLPIHINFEKF